MLVSPWGKSDKHLRIHCGYQAFIITVNTYAQLNLWQAKATTMNFLYDQLNFYEVTFPQIKVDNPYKT